MLLYLDHNPILAFWRHNLKGVIERRHIARRKLNINHRAHDLDDATVSHVLTSR
jgi:hypothetical protein